MLPPQSQVTEEDVLSSLAWLRDFCVANALPSAAAIVQDCLLTCENLYVERKRAAFTAAPPPSKPPRRKRRRQH